MQRIKQAINKHLPQKIKMDMLDRTSKLRFGITKEQKGLEFGPLHSPIVPKRDGYCVETVDCMSQEELREHYKNDNINLEAIEPVDYVWKGGSYYKLIHREHYYDYIIASHMIEHSTDFCGFLSDCSRLLKQDGILKLAIPDKRYCFDHYRTVTNLAEILNNALAPSELQSEGYVAEYYMNVVSKKGSISWDRRTPSFRDSLENRRDKSYSFVHDKNAALDGISKVRRGEYVDIHHYVFVPASFELLIYDLRVLGMLDFKIVQMWDTRGNEFIVALQKTDEEPQWDPNYRKRLLHLISRQNVS